jgi:choice-of-anchor A domain-containing protein
VPRTSTLLPARPRAGLRKLVAVATVGAFAAFGAATPALSAPLHTPKPITDTCEEGSLPGVGNPTSPITDENVSVFVGGNYRSTNAESEGLLVVLGDAWNQSGLLNVGTVGVGSGILPESGSVMLAVGGDLIIDTEIQVAHPIGGVTWGKVQVGGEIKGSHKTHISTGSHPHAAEIQEGIGKDAAVGEWLHLTDLITSESQRLGKIVPSQVITQWTSPYQIDLPSGNEVKAVEINASALNQLSGSAVHFLGDAAVTGPLVINVIDDTNGVLNIDFSSFFSNSKNVDFTDPEFPHLASKLLWNIDSSFKDITIGGKGKGGNQFFGTVLSASGTAVVTLESATNGRIWVNGDLNTLNGGNEQHAYPWIGGGVFDCTPTPGPEEPETPEVPETPEEPETPDTPDQPETPEGPEQPEVPETPETPQGPESPEEPGSPENPDEPTVDVLGEEEEQLDDPTEPSPTPSVGVLDDTVEADEDDDATTSERSDEADDSDELVVTGAAVTGAAIISTLLLAAGLGMVLRVRMARD